MIELKSTIKSKKVSKRKILLSLFIFTIFTFIEVSEIRRFFTLNHIQMDYLRKDILLVTCWFSIMLISFFSFIAVGNFLNRYIVDIKEKRYIIRIISDYRRERKVLITYALKPCQNK